MNYKYNVIHGKCKGGKTIIAISTFYYLFLDLMFLQSTIFIGYTS